MGIRHAVVVLPVRDEADALAVLLPEVMKEINTSPVPLKLLVVDDGSTDESGSVAASHGIAVVSQEAMGKPPAVRRGFEYAMREGIDAAIVFDGDGQHPTGAIQHMVDLLDRYEIIKGTRFHERSLQIGTPRDRLVLNRRIRSRLTDITGWAITDPQCGLVGMQREVIRKMLPRLRWIEEWEIELILHLHLLVGSAQCPIYEFPIAARYAELPGAKQREKYHPHRGRARLNERLTRQMRVIDETLRDLECEKR